MKNSLKFMTEIAFSILIVTIFTQKVYAVEDPYIVHNKYVLSYVPSDIQVIRGDKRNLDPHKNGGYACDANGNLLHRNRKPESASQNKIQTYSCTVYHSKSRGTSWVVRWEIAPHGPVFAEQIFQLKNGRLSPWASFNNKRENIFATKEAQKFASNKGDRNTDVARSSDESENKEVAQAPQPVKENCAGKNFFEKAACELKNAGVENAVGTVINNSR